MLDRTVPPPFQRTSRFDLIEPFVADLTNGLRVYYLSGGEQEVIKIEAVFRAGRWYEQSWGAAYFAGSLLNKGTQSKSSFDIARIFDLYGAHVEISPGLDLISVSLYTLTKNLEPVLELFYEIITGATFPEKEFEQSRSIYLQNLQVNKEKTSFQAGKFFRKHLFGDVHPYGKELDDAEVKLLSRENVMDHYSNFFSDLFVVVSGRVSEKSRTLVDKTFSALTLRQSRSISLHPPDDQPQRHLYDKDGSVQASVRVGKRFIGRSHSDYPDVLLLNHILGGYFGSRLMKNIREEKGLTYGIYSSIHTLIRDNYIVIGADVNKENLSLAFDEIASELNRLRNEPIGKDELQTARNHFIGSLQAEITTPFSHADKLKNILIYGLPADYYTRLIRRIDSLTADDLMDKADQYLQPDSFYQIAVG